MVRQFLELELLIIYLLLNLENLHRGSTSWKFKAVSILLYSLHISYILTKLYYVTSCSLKVATCFIFSACCFLSQLKSFPFQILSFMKVFSLFTIFPLPKQVRSFSENPYRYILVHVYILPRIDCFYCFLVLFPLIVSFFKGCDPFYSLLLIEPSIFVCSRCWINSGCTYFLIFKNSLLVQKHCRK